MLGCTLHMLASEAFVQLLHCGRELRIAMWQGNWEFAERARQSIQEEEGASTSRARAGAARRYKTQSSLDKPLSNSALLEVAFACLLPTEAHESEIP